MPIPQQTDQANPVPVGKLTPLQSTGVPVTNPQQGAQQEDPRQMSQRLARQYGVDPEMVNRMVQQESGWNPRAVSPVGAQGLLQLMPETQKAWKVQDPFNPEQNLSGGIQYFKSLLDKYNGDVNQALTEYGGFRTKDPRAYIQAIAGQSQDQQPRPVGRLTPVPVGKLSPIQQGQPQAQPQEPSWFEKASQLSPMLQGLGAINKAGQFMAQKGAKLGETLGGIASQNVPGIVPGMDQPTYQASPQQAGFMKGVGSTVGGIAGDFRQWPFLFMPSGALGPVFDRVLSAGFAGQMGYGSYEQIQNLRQNWDAMSPEQRAQGITEAGLGGIFTLGATHGAIAPHPQIGQQQPLHTGQTPEMENFRLTPREPVQPSGVLRAPTQTPVQVAPRQAANLGVEGGPQPITQTGQTTAQEITGRTTGAVGRSTAGQPPEPTTTVGTVTPKPTGPPAGEMQPYAPPASLQQKIGEARKAGLLPEQRGRVATAPYTGPERRLEDVAREQMTTGMPGQATPGQQLTQQMREAQAGPKVPDEMQGLVMQRILRDPQLYQKFKSADERGQIAIATQVKDQLLKEQQGAQRPTGLPQAPTSTAAQPAGPALESIRGAQEPTSAAREPLRAAPEPVRQVAPKAAPKPYVPLPPEQRPRVSAGAPRTEPMAAPPRATTLATPPPVSEIRPATPRPAGATPTELEGWKVTRQAEASERQEAMRRQAQAVPATRDIRQAAEPWHSLGRTMDRVLKTEKSEARNQELRDAVERVKAQGPEVVKAEAEKARVKAERAQRMAEWGLDQLEPERQEFIKEMRGEGGKKSGTAYTPGRLSAGAVGQISEGYQAWAEKRGLSFDPRSGKEKAAAWRSDIASHTREAINRALGNTMKEVGERKTLSPEDEREVANLESKRDELVKELQRRPRPTERQLDQLESLIVNINARRGIAHVAEKGPQAQVGEHGELLPSATANREMWNRFNDRPVGEHSTRPSDEQIKARVEKLKAEARLSRSVARQLGVDIAEPVDRVIAKPAEKAETPTTALAPSTPKARVEPSETPLADTLRHDEKTAKPDEELEGLKKRLAELESAQPKAEAKTEAEKPSTGMGVPSPKMQAEIRKQLSGKTLKGPERAAREAAKAPEKTAEAKPETVAHPTKGGPWVTKISQAIEAMDDLGERVGRLPKNLREDVGKRLGDVRVKLETLNERISNLSKAIGKMREAGETTRTYKDESGKEHTVTLEGLEHKRMLLGQERSKHLEEHLPSLKTAVAALERSTGEVPTEFPTGKAEKTTAPVTRYEYNPDTRKMEPVRTREEEVAAPPTGTPSKAELLEQLKQAQEHLKNLINKSVETDFNRYGKDSKKFGSSAEQKGAVELRKLIADLQRQIGPNAPGAAEGTKETIDAQGLLKASGEFKKPERMTAGEPAQLAPEDAVADLHAILNAAKPDELGSASLDFINKALPSGSAQRTFGPAADMMAKPILDEMRAGNIPIEVAAKRLESSLRELAKGFSEAKKAPEEMQSDVRRAAVLRARKLAKGEKLDDKAGERGFLGDKPKGPQKEPIGLVGGQRGKGLAAAERIRKEREAEEKGPFYNKSERVVREEWPGEPTSKQNAKDVAGMLVNAGVSKNELKWSDVDSYLLKAQKEGRQVTRDEVLKYLKEHNPRIEVTEKKKGPALDKEWQSHIDKVNAKEASTLEAATAFIRENMGLSNTGAEGIVDDYMYGGGRGSIKLSGPDGKKLSLEQEDKLEQLINAHRDATQEASEWERTVNDQERGGPRYESYSLPGGENYREVLLRMPLKYRDVEGSAPERLQIAGTEDQYHGPHFDEPNVVAHLRLKDRVDADGKKTLFIEEVQSDWDREIREAEKKVEQARGETAAEQYRNSRLADVPKMPFTQGHWLELAMKHVLKEAASKGYDSVAWTTGEQQADRYSLSKAVDTLHYNPKSESLWALKDGKTVQTITDLPKERLANTIGKDVANRLLAQPLKNFKDDPNRAVVHTLEGADLKLGGEHHLQLYDKMIPQFMEKYGKKWGAKVGESDFETEGKGSLDFKEWKAGLEPSTVAKLSDAELRARFNEESGIRTTHSMQIPEGMRDVLKQPLRMMGGSQAGFMGRGKKLTAAQAKRQTQAKALHEAIEQNHPHQIADRLNSLIKGLPKGTVDARIKMASEAIKAGPPSTAPGRVRQSLTNAMANIRTFGSWYWNGERNGIKLRDALKGQTDPKLGYKEALGHYNEAYQVAASDAHAMVKNIRDAHAPEIRQAMHLGLDTAFDKHLLEKAANNTKLPEDLRKAAYLAQRLTPEEMSGARLMQNFFHETGEMLSRVGALRHMLENYVPHMLDTEGPEGQKFMGELRAGVFDTNFKYARQRIHETMVAGAEKGVKYQLGIDRALWDYHRRAVQATSSRAFIKELSGVSQADKRPALVPGYNTMQAILPSEYSKYPAIQEALKASPAARKGLTEAYMFRDNRGPSGPIADVSVMEALGIPYNEKTITENDKARMDVADYKHVDHPDFKQTVFVGKGPDGKPVFYRADLYAHPAIYEDLKNIYEASQFKSYKLTRAASAVTSGSKRLLLKILPSGFHYSQEGLHSIGHGVNPLKPDIWSGKLSREAVNDPIIRKGLRHGLQLYDYDYSDAMEGIKGVKGFEKDFENHLFGKFIPGLKIETFKKQLAKNLDTYVKKGYSEDRVYEMTAQQINNAYGMQNRLFTGRTKFMQDLFRLTALAPDFLESRARFVGSAFRPGGRQQAMALMRLGLYMYGTARALNAMTNDGDAKWHPKDAFTWHFRGHEYSMRSVITDSLFAATDLSSFLASRGALIPRAIFAEGQKSGTPRFLKDKQPSGVIQGLIRSITPIVAQRPALALLKKAYEQKNGPSVAWETFAGLLEAIAGVREKEEVPEKRPSRASTGASRTRRSTR